jgi:hypothetical protein
MTEALTAETEECVHLLPPMECSICRARLGYRPGTDRQRSDCTVQAVAALTAATYREAEALLAAAGRRPGQGAPAEVTCEAIRSAGWTVAPSPLTIEEALRSGGFYLVSAWRRRRGHAFALIGGQAVNAGQYISGGCRYRLFEVS